MLSKPSISPWKWKKPNPEWLIGLTKQSSVATSLLVETAIYIFVFLYILNTENKHYLLTFITIAMLLVGLNR